MEPTRSRHLRAQIASTRINNWKGRSFVPFHSLAHIIDAETVQNVIEECGIEVYRSHEASEAVLKGGKRVFGVLNAMGKEKFILNFKKTDPFLDRPLDSGLPFEEQALKSILPNDYRDFYDWQWSFASPVFKKDLHERNLPEETILPFTAVVKSRNQGAFAKVSRVKLPSSHQEIFQTSSSEVYNRLAVNHAIRANLFFCRLKLFGKS